MKLAEALIIRADLQKRIFQLRERLKDSGRVQEGDQPSEDINLLYQELEQNVNQLEDLIYRINVTNMETKIQHESLTRLMAHKDALTLRLSVLRDLLEHVTQPAGRYSRSEIKYVRTLDVATLRQQVDDYSRQLRELNIRIQELNWTVDLL